MSKKQYKVKYENGHLTPLEPINFDEVKEGIVIFFDEEVFRGHIILLEKKLFKKLRSQNYASAFGSVFASTAATFCAGAAFVTFGVFSFAPNRSTCTTPFSSLVAVTFT